MLDLRCNHILRLGCIFGALGVLASCSGTGANVRRDNVNGDTPGGDGTSGTLDTTGTGTINATTGSGGANGSTDGKGTGCQQLDKAFVPKTPTVFVLVDRSGSMFGSGAWDPLRKGVLNVIQTLQKDIRFGFGAFTGEQGQTCPMFDKVDANLNNYDAINAVYQKLGMPQKGETPTMKVLAMVKDLLVADPNEGGKYILFVTDGEPDYCADGNILCPVDAVIGRLQELNKNGINTFVFGLKSKLSDISDATLQAFANAGAGQPVVPPAPVGDIWNQCFYGGDPNAIGWKADAAAAGVKMNQTLATYATMGGAAKVFAPDPTNEMELTDQMRSAINGVKSCLFDLTGKIEVDVSQIDKANVFIGADKVPQSTVNGWRLNTSTQVELVGDACRTWLSDPTEVDIHWDFPCKIAIAK